ncbi:MAG: hypothetical protein WDA03_04095 [Trueperaceae bacterium]
MRGLITFLIIVAVVFFAVGEARGWYLGFPTQTPILVYKKDHTADTSRRTLSRTDMPVRFTGEVQRGSVHLEVRYQRPSSFQTNTGAGSEQVVFEQTWTRGQRIAFDRLFELGGGVYTVYITYSDATGIFRLTMPDGIDL